MSAQGRGRGEAPKLARLEEGDPPEAGQSQISGDEPEKTIRGRGGFRSSELRTIPSTCKGVKAQPEKTSRPIEVTSNFICLFPMSKTKSIYQYRLDFSPNVESTPLRKQLFKATFGNLFEEDAIFDGGSDVRGSTKLPKSPMSKTVPRADEPGALQEVTIKEVGIVQWASFEMLRLYNMHMKKILLALGFYRLNSLGAFVNPQICTPIGSGDTLTMVRGYRTAANVHEADNILMNLESVHKIMQRKNVLQIFQEIVSKTGDRFKQVIEGEMVGKLVVTNYSKKQCFKVEGVDFSKNPHSKFIRRGDGKEVSFIDYFQQAYNVKIHDERQPLLLVTLNSKRRFPDETEKKSDLFLIPELCNIAGLTEPQRNDFRLKGDLIRSSQVPPRDRVAHMNTFLQKLHSNELVSKMLNSWGYAYDKETIKIKARVLANEHICLGSSAQAPAVKWPTVDANASFDGALIRDRLVKSPVFPKMAILIPKSLANDEGHIINDLQAAFSKIKLAPGNVDRVRMMQGESAHHYVQYLRNLPLDVTAAIILMEKQNKEKYDAIKKFAACERGLITQVVTGKLMNDQRKASGAAVKIGIQIAAKVGGEPWYVDLPLRGAMICGYDTYHDTANRGRSYGAFVASLNDKFSSWYSKADSHDRLEELSSHLSENLILALRKYKEINRKFPDRLFLYRDGVSDGQIDHVYKVEVAQIQSALREIDGEVALTVIIVNKRIGARFYLRQQDGFANCPPGTVIDDVVTRKHRFDFYLISQSTRAGTVAPTYYNIIHDESALTTDRLQAMAYKLCFLYYNWSGSVKVPAPCQYAHKLALLCGEHLHAVPNAVLDDRLHFL